MTAGEGQACGTRTRGGPPPEASDVAKTGVVARERGPSPWAGRALRAAVLLALVAEGAAFIGPLSSCFGIKGVGGGGAGGPQEAGDRTGICSASSSGARPSGPVYAADVFHTEDGRVVRMKGGRGKRRGVGVDELPRPMRVCSGEFAEFEMLWGDEDASPAPCRPPAGASSCIVPFSLSSRPSGPVGGVNFLRLRGGSRMRNGLGAGMLGVRLSPGSNETEPDKGTSSSLPTDLAHMSLSKSGAAAVAAQGAADIRAAALMVGGGRASRRAADGGRSLRVALFTWESLHTIAVGGVAPHVTELAAGLERRGHEVHVYSRTGDGQLPYEIVDGVHIHRVPIALDPDFIAECNNMCNSFCWFMRESEQFQGAKFDVCHGHDWLAAKAVVQCKNMGRSTVVTIHSTEFGRCGNVNYGGQSERIRKVEEEVAYVADRVISVSGVLCDEVKLQFGISSDKLRMVYNGIHLAPYLGTVDAGAVKARNSIGPLDPVVLFVGRLATQKGPDLLVEAIPLVLNTRHDVKFLIVGDGYMKTDLERRVQELGIAHAVRFLGSMSGRPLVELFKSADCVCLPSRNEPFGIVVLEAWASGKPVVATSSGGPREFVDHGVDGYHVHPSANSISWGICEIFSNFDKSRIMGVKGRAKAQQKFNWDKIAEETESIYRELVGH